MKLFNHPNCYTIARYSIFKLARRLGKKYRYEEEGYNLFCIETTSEIEFYMETSNLPDFLGYATYVEFNMQELEVSLNVNFRDTDSGTDYCGKEVLKGIYDIILKKYNPTVFKAIYINDNYAAFHHFLGKLNDLKLAFNNIPSGRVLVKRAFEVDLNNTTISGNYSVETFWNKLKCN